MTQTSQLSSLLVRDGLVQPNSMEQVFVRQVISGGALDTILLEMGLVEDHRLQQYLSLATGLPIANPVEDEDRDTLVELCSQELASEFGVLPVALGDDALEVWVCDPVQEGSLEAVAEKISLKLTPMVVLEYQYQLRFAELYGESKDERFEKLAAKEQREQPAIVADKPKKKGQVSARIKMPEELHSAAVPKAIEPESTQPADTTERVRGKRPPAQQPERRTTQEFSTDVVRKRASALQEEAGNAQISEGPPESEDTEVSASIPVAISESVSGSGAKDKPSIEDDGISALSADEARQLLGQSEDRDEIFHILLRAFRRRVRHASLFTLKGKVATGRVALTKEGFDKTDIKNISVSLESDSRFQLAYSSKAFSVGDFEGIDPSLVPAISSLGQGEIPKTALLLPIVMRERVIAIAVGHNFDKGISVGRVTELLPLGTATADAVSRLLAMKRAEKAGGGKDAVPQPVENAATTKTETIPVPVADEGMVDLFARLESEDRDEAEKAKSEALSQIDKTIAHLDFHFPGKLLKCRKEQKQRLRAEEHGPVLALISAIGPKTGPVLAEKMRDADRETRYYATLCAAELRPGDVLNELVERLFDGDERIRTLAVEALSGYPKAELHEGLDFARRALHSEDNERVKVAADGLTRLVDCSAIPDLLDAHSRGGEAAEVCSTALQRLTNQDFGSSNRQWRAWWEENQGKHRVEWMLEGLSGRNKETRKLAVEALQEMTGEKFGFKAGASKKEREKKRKLWVKWWNEKGSELFSK